MPEPYHQMPRCSVRQAARYLRSGARYLRSGARYLRSGARSLRTDAQTRKSPRRTQVCAVCEDDLGSRLSVLLCPGAQRGEHRQSIGGHRLSYHRRIIFELDDRAHVGTGIGLSTGRRLREIP